MFHNDNGGTFWIAKDDFQVPVQMTVYVDSSYDSPNANAKASLKHHSSGFVFWTAGGTLREINYGLTRQDYKGERLMTSENAELIGINKVLKYILQQDVQPERLVLICDNQTLVKKLNDIREVYKILGKFPASEYPTNLHKAEYDTYIYLMKLFPNLTFEHVKGHADSEFNHVADRLAHLGKSVKSGSDHPEELILQTLAKDSIQWHSTYLSKPKCGEFFLGLTQKRVEARSGCYRYGVCLYDAKNNVFHTEVFESIVKPGSEIPVVSAVHGLEALYGILPKGAAVDVIVDNDFTAHVLHTYAENYIVPSGVLSRNTLLELAEHRKAIKKYSQISFRSAPGGYSEKQFMDNLNKANREASRALEENLRYRSLYVSAPVLATEPPEAADENLEQMTA